MNMAHSRPPGFLRPFFPRLTWSKEGCSDEIFLTFDDGPHPEITPRILDALAEHKARATFFCMGRQVEKHTEIFNRIKSEGHSVGNHSHTHPDGWKTRNHLYFADIARAQSLIGSRFFRPPYGRIRPSQIAHLRNFYEIIMWSWLPGDFYRPGFGRGWEKNLKPGTIVALHDYPRAMPFFKQSFGLLLNEISKNHLKPVNLVEKKQTTP